MSWAVGLAAALLGMALATAQAPHRGSWVLLGLVALLAWALAS